MRRPAGGGQPPWSSQSISRQSASLVTLSGDLGVDLRRERDPVLTKDGHRDARVILMGWYAANDGSIRSKGTFMSDWASMAQTREESEKTMAKLIERERLPLR